MGTRRLAAAIVLLVTIHLPRVVHAQAQPLLRQLEAIAARSPGHMSVHAVHVASGERVSLHGDDPVFMASVVKLPIALQLLARVDAGELRLTDTVTVAPHDLRTGHTPLAEQYPQGFRMRIDSLLRHSLSIGDNTASDALLRYSGGPARVTRELERLGIFGIRIDRDYSLYSWHYSGIMDPPARATLAERTRIRASLTELDYDSAVAALNRRMEDRASAAAVTQLLVRLARGELLSERSRALLLRLMTDSQNPVDGIVAGVPAGTRVAHKTGAWGGWRNIQTSVNDVGLITLPEGRGTLAVAIMIANAQAEPEVVWRAIAAATPALYTSFSRAR